MLSSKIEPQPRLMKRKVTPIHKERLMSMVQHCSCGQGSSCPSRARQTEPQMDLIHSSGVLVIQHLQSNYKDYHDFLDFMSSVGDPRNIFSLYFPLWFQLSQIVGTKMIWVAVIGDWFNLIFKWILFGQRPYWWVHETLFYQNNSLPQLEQFHITCETGPGSPSGHAMGSSCVWYVMITSALNFSRRLCDSSTQGCQRFGLVWSFLWMAFWIIQISVGISRIFIATHFPHQVILGVLAGILVAEAFEHVPSIHTASLKVYLHTSLFLFSFAVSLYLLLKMIDIDLLWSIPKAKKWCANPDWIHLDTTPFAGLVRNLGALFGLGLAINSQMFIQSCKVKNGYKTRFKLVCVAANLTSLQLYDFIKIPTHTEILFYTLSFCKSAAVPLSVVALIPYGVHLLIGDKERKLD
ncbi:glucose-6-phosphatase 2 isoform X2 [Oncorhynchus tshawytscha]|uniref:Glucose-6-phosphatase 2 n=1 Tax=Oncorhynchus tshawytscha TaxID=74940 RepID=A0A8C8D7E3_ONCTS|nr:glucose-6-phosphatase 2 isoform X2 [Oncorhynchus tshawytscha]